MRVDGASADVLELIARTVRGTRAQLSWSQRELSRKSGVAQSQISRIERCRFPGVRLATIDRLFAAMGVRYRFVIEPPQSVTRHQDDLVHARCSAYAGRRLRSAGWLVEREVEIGDGRSRGWIDLLAFNPDTGCLVVIEIKTEIHDVGQIERTMNWYQREAVIAARRLGWRPRRIAAALLILQSMANDTILMANRDIVADAFPGRARDLQQVIAGRGGPRGTLVQVRHVAMIDPRSHRAVWVRPTWLDGRRSPAPYRDYLDAVRVLESRTRVGPH